MGRLRGKYRTSVDLNNDVETLSYMDMCLVPYSSTSTSNNATITLTEATEMAIHTITGIFGFVGLSSLIIQELPTEIVAGE